jgi:hypothetical protein
VSAGARDDPGLARPVRFFLRDYPWAVRTRLRSTRDRAVPSSWTRGGGAPVVLLPGVYETWHFLRAIGDRLAADGHPVHVVHELGRNAAPIDVSAALVWRRIVADDLRGVVLVAHSKGGLIGKHLLAVDDTEQRIDRLVAVATPFGGSSRARWFRQRAMRDFRVDDPLLRRLGDRRDVDARITSVFPVLDPHIPEGSRLDGAAANLQIRMAGHFGILEDPRALDAVAAAAR